MMLVFCRNSPIWLDRSSRLENSGDSRPEGGGGGGGVGFGWVGAARRACIARGGGHSSAGPRLCTHGCSRDLPLHPWVQMKQEPLPEDAKSCERPMPTSPAT